MLRNACRQSCLGARAPPPQHARQSIREARPLAFFLSRACLAARFVRRTCFEHQPPAGFRRAHGQVSAAAAGARRMPMLDAVRLIDGLRESGAPSYDVFCRAWRAYMAREREAGLEAAAMDVIR